MQILEMIKRLDKKEKIVLVASGGILLILVLLFLLPALRDSKRKSDLQKLVDSVYSYAIDNNGRLPDTDGIDSQNSFPKTERCVGTGPVCFDLGGSGSYSNPKRIVPDYLKNLPKDPQKGTAENTGYTIYKNSDGKIVAGVKGELMGNIQVVK